SPASVTTVTLTAGNLITTNANLLTVSGTTVGSITGSATAYVQGPLARTLPQNYSAGGTYSFPIGKSAYQLFSLIAPTTANSASLVVIRAESFDANAGGTA